ncbi:hypothetical protein D3C80_1897080 [compost metagenome]
MADKLLRLGEGNAYRHPLNDLDPVPSGVLCGQQRKRSTGPNTQMLYLTVIANGFAIDIGIDLYWLTDANITQLGLGEISLDPDFIQRYDGH